MPKTHITIIYDSVDNAVFVSQVMTPVRRRKEQHPNSTFVLITCEREHKTVPGWPGPVYVVLRSRFFGSVSLWPLVWKVRKILKQYEDYEITARGPHAGWVAVRASSGPVTIQARGLLAQEYLYTHTNNFVHKLRARLYATLERATYRSKKAHIEAVSPALKEYLVQTWGADPARISIAESDKPAHLSLEERTHWRTKVRAELFIPATARVYCYAGSAKKWQLPEETVALFAQKMGSDPESFLLIYTQEPKIFEQAVHKYQIPANRVRIMSVPATQVIQYCAAADIGILLRDQSPVNWVSRPTKALEYRAAGLEILHNGTVKFLLDHVGESTSGS